MADHDRTRRPDGAEHSVDGKLTQAKGKMKDAAGGITGDSSLQADGKLDQAKGKAQGAFGKGERKLDP